MILIQYVYHISLLRFKVQKEKVQAVQTKQQQPLCGKLFTFTKTDKLFVCTIRSSFCNSYHISCPPNNILTLEALALSFEVSQQTLVFKSKLPNIISPTTLFDHMSRHLRKTSIKSY